MTGAAAGGGEGERVSGWRRCLKVMPVGAAEIYTDLSVLF